MKHGSLFNGDGGFQLAAHWMGWENVMSCEIEERCNKVTKKHFPNCIQHGDIRTTDFRIYHGLIDLLTGGEPCQPHSYAGQRKGKEDERYLWPEFKRAVAEIQPCYIVNENVPGTITNGVLDQKISDLESEGYTCWPPLNIPASATGALHKRHRVWLVAHSERRIKPRQESCGGQVGRMGREFEPLPWHSDWEGALREFRRVDDGLSYGVERLDGIRNAIVPHVALDIFKMIEQFDANR